MFKSGDDPIESHQMKRSRQQISHDILACAIGEKVRISQIMQHVGLTSEQIKSSLIYLVDSGMIERELDKSKRSTYKTTPKGMEYFKTIDEMTDLFRT